MGVPVVLDYRHLTRKDNYGFGIRVTLGGPDLFNFMRSVNPDRIAAIHIHPPSTADLLDWLLGGNSEFAHFTRASLNLVRGLPRSVPVVLETSPVSPGQLRNLKKGLDMIGGASQTSRSGSLAVRSAYG